jgi:hypothetical protein
VPTLSRLYLSLEDLLVHASGRNFRHGGLVISALLMVLYGIT